MNSSDQSSDPGGVNYNATAAGSSPSAPSSPNVVHPHEISSPPEPAPSFLQPPAPLPPPASSPTSPATFNVLLCVTGSVAAIRAPDIVRLLLHAQPTRPSSEPQSPASHPAVISVRVVLTEHATHFVHADPIHAALVDTTTPIPHPIPSQCGNCHHENHLHHHPSTTPNKPHFPPEAPVYHDTHEWQAWNRLRDPVLHIQLRNWAHLLLIAPLSANSLAKIANGLCDNLVTSIARAWPVPHKPFVVAPAMNTAMWNHPVTTTHLNTITNPHFGVTVVPPVTKVLACGEVGFGAMATPADITSAVTAHWHQ